MRTGRKVEANCAEEMMVAVCWRRAGSVREISRLQHARTARTHTHKHTPECVECGERASDQVAAFNVVASDIGAWWCGYVDVCI